jgi:class 3 adenylate cyclase
MSGEVPAWLATIGLGRYAAGFAEKAVELRDLARLTQADIAKLVVPVADRRRLTRAIATLAAAAAETETPARHHGRVRRVAERRHLTVMFCDIVGSTALSHRLDPEELSALMQRYRRICARVAGQFGGHVARYTGDGVLIYFGWPQAFEDHAERSIRAGLELIEALAAERYSVRVGIASGLVAIGAADDEYGMEDVIG